MMCRHGVPIPEGSLTRRRSDPHLRERVGAGMDLFRTVRLRIRSVRPRAVCMALNSQQQPLGEYLALSRLRTRRQSGLPPLGRAIFVTAGHRTNGWKHMGAMFAVFPWADKRLGAG